MNSITSFSTVMGSQLEVLAKKIECEPKQSPINQNMNYFETLDAIHEITQPLFNTLADLAEKAGFKKVEAFAAWPKGLCENFIFGVVDGAGNVTDVVLARNKKH